MKNTTSHLNKYQPGAHFLQIPGPTNIPNRILRAISKPIIDHRGPEFAQLTLSLLDRLKQLFKTSNHVFIYPSSGTGMWEAALVNVLSPGDKILAFETWPFCNDMEKCRYISTKERKFNPLVCYLYTC